MHVCMYVCMYVCVCVCVCVCKIVFVCVFALVRGARKWCVYVWCVDAMLLSWHIKAWRCRSTNKAIDG